MTSTGVYEPQLSQESYRSAVSVSFAASPTTSYGGEKQSNFFVRNNPLRLFTDPPEPPPSRIFEVFDYVRRQTLRARYEMCWLATYSMIQAPLVFEDDRPDFILNVIGLIVTIRAYYLIVRICLWRVMADMSRHGFADASVSPSSPLTPATTGEVTLERSGLDTTAANSNHNRKEAKVGKKLRDLIQTVQKKRRKQQRQLENVFSSLRCNPYWKQTLAEVLAWSIFSFPGLRGWGVSFADDLDSGCFLRVYVFVSYFGMRAFSQHFFCASFARLAHISLGHHFVLGVSFERYPTQSFLSIICFCWTVLSLLFSKLEGRTFYDSIYFVFVTTGTIGYGDIAPITVGGKCISILCGCLNFVLVSYFLLNLGRRMEPNRGLRSLLSFSNALLIAITRRHIAALVVQRALQMVVAQRKWRGGAPRQEIFLSNNSPSPTHSSDNNGHPSHMLGCIPKRATLGLYEAQFGLNDALTRFRYWQKRYQRARRRVRETLDEYEDTATLKGLQATMLGSKRKQAFSLAARREIGYRHQQLVDPLWARDRMLVRNRDRIPRRSFSKGGATSRQAARSPTALSSSLGGGEEDLFPREMSLQKLGTIQEEPADPTSTSSVAAAAAPTTKSRLRPKDEETERMHHRSHHRRTLSAPAWLMPPMDEEVNASGEEEDEAQPRDAQTKALRLQVEVVHKKMGVTLRSMSQEAREDPLQRVEAKLQYLTYLLSRLNEA